MANTDTFESQTDIMPTLTAGTRVKLGPVWGIERQGSMATFADRATELSAQFDMLADYIIQVRPPMSTEQLREHFDGADLDPADLAAVIELGTALSSVDFTETELGDGIIWWVDGSSSQIYQQRADEWSFLP